MQLKMTRDLGHERCTREQGHLAKGLGTRIPTFLPLSVGKLKSHRSMVKRPACVKAFRAERHWVPSQLPERPNPKGEPWEQPHTTCQEPRAEGRAGKSEIGWGPWRGQGGAGPWGPGKQRERGAYSTFADIDLVSPSFRPRRLQEVSVSLALRHVFRTRRPRFSPTAEVCKSPNSISYQSAWCVSRRVTRRAAAASEDLGPSLRRVAERAGPGRGGWGRPVGRLVV